MMSRFQNPFRKIPAKVVAPPRCDFPIRFGKSYKTRDGGLICQVEWDGGRTRVDVPGVVVAAGVDEVHDFLRWAAKRRNDFIKARMAVS